MNKAGTIILIIFLLLLAVGLGLFAFFFSIGKIELNDNYYRIFHSYSEKLVDSKDVDKSDEIYVDAKVTDIFVEESTDNKIHVELYTDNDCEKNIEFKDSILNVKFYVKGNTWFFSKASRLVVKLPTDYSGKLKIENTVGDIKVGDFTNLKPSIKLNVGDIQIARLEEATIDVGTGDIKVDYINNYININQGTGDTKLGTVYTADISASTGDVRIDNVNNRINIINSTGDIRINNATLNEDSSISNKTGDIKVGSLSGVYIEASNNVGDIKVKNNDRTLEHTINVHTNTGDIKINQ